MLSALAVSLGTLVWPFPTLKGSSVPPTCRPWLGSQVVVEALMGKLATVNKPGMLREVERIAVDAWALLQALPALDDWTAAQARPLWQQGGGADGGTDDRKDGAGMAGQQASGAR